MNDDGKFFILAFIIGMLTMGAISILLMILFIGQIYLKTLLLLLLGFIFSLAFFFSYKYRRDYAIETYIDDCMPSNIDNIKHIIDNIFYKYEKRYGKIKKRRVDVENNEVIIKIRMFSGELICEKIDIRKYVERKKMIKFKKGV